MTSKKYRISPPPKDKGNEPLFRIIYTIDVSAANPSKAAEAAWEMMRAQNAMNPVLVILDNDGNQVKIDLSECLELNKVTTGFVIQRYRKQITGTFKCIGQEFIAGDEVQFENLKGEPVDPPEHDYQPFNMTMLSKDEIINRLTCVLSSIDVGGEQSRQFSEEIENIKGLLQDLGWKPNDES